ncbi:SMI1/KNR4 family protein [Bacillus sp. L381]|uniref:SMI1/KNR4 family protein n=1 Tax=Bacillus TaxID=1386 RepID=UPI001BA4C8E9|nr:MULTISPECIES: SMI1/KNR4 family protein [Bacillus]MCR9039742.1 SMI1/KNR4 family protein [Bacillus velezensis]MCZ4247732.1 SMI1/KNR4 family protein [Bacillus amyloliquefaciens]QUN09259.1 SMI1/KNR4 family protein [Bacillus amyloliquefaciens]QYM82333.1 SMI1/KNR4 family protein [Bacillus sp. 7D3]QZY11564.1 SMI1/KNR4 family protein [Bacillus amyloliquefaciens]
MKYDFIKSYKENTFYPVSENEILEVENKLGLRLPYDLRQFLLEVGYGFLKKSEYNINRILGPASIRDARLKVNDFEFYPDIEVYEELEEDKVIFFEANESALLLIELGNEQNNSIYYDDIKIADSLEEFLIELMKNDKYYLDLIED